MSDSKSDITEDFFLNGKLRLIQPKKGHRAGHDAILLAAMTSAQAGDRVVDLGAGVGTAGLAVSRRIEGIDLVLVEIETALVDLATKNATLNGLDARALALDVEADAAAFAALGLSPDSVDVVLMNPPFNDASRLRPSPIAERQLAHMATRDTLPAWIAAARRLLKSGGVLTLIWRADGLADVLAALDAGFGSLDVLPVHAMPDQPAIRILIRAIKAGRAPTVLHPGFALNGISGMPDARTQAVMAGDAVLPLPVVSGGQRPLKK